MHITACDGASGCLLQGSAVDHAVVSYRSCRPDHEVATRIASPVGLYRVKSGVKSGK